LKLVTRADEVNATGRPRHRYKLTATGRKEAQRGWKEILRSGDIPPDIDSLLRVADIALYNKAPMGQIGEILKAAGRRRLNRAEQFKVSLRASDLDSYVGLKTRVDVARFIAEGKALAFIAHSARRTSRPVRKRSVITSLGRRSTSRVS
jgi:hypothetical protein